MTATANGFRWGVERRLEFIEFRLFWEGGVNRSDIVDEFGVSVPQASKDLTLYQDQAPDNIRYDRSLKKYFASEFFEPAFISLDADAYLGRLAAGEDIGKAPVADLKSLSVIAEQMPVPQRRIEPNVLRSLLTCVREKRSIEVLYQSMSPTRPEPLWRRMSAHAFGNDGLRWHARAFCHIEKKFKDFILSRCLKVRDPAEPGALRSKDANWENFFPVALSPNPRLSPSQQNVIAQDFGMKDDEVSVPVRCALLYYFSKRLRLDVAERFDDPREAPVVVKNRSDFDIALADAMR